MKHSLTLLATIVFATSALPLTAAELPALDRVRALAEPKAIADAALTDQYGREAHLADLRGKVAFVLFGFTNCPDVCPVAMERLREVYDSGKLANDDVQYVMISVDGERDTPAAMRAFLAKYSEHFVGLTAAPDAVRPLAESFSVAFFQGAHRHDGGYDVAHSPQIFVLDAAGALRAEFYGASLDSMVTLAEALLAETR